MARERLKSLGPDLGVCAFPKVRLGAGGLGDPSVLLVAG